MTKTTYIATDANGTVHKRKTERSYSHTVVFQRSKERAIELANTRVKEDIKSAKHSFDTVAAGQDAYVDAGVREFPRLGRDYFMHRFMKEAEFVAQWGTPEAYAAHRHMEEIARIEATDYGVWHNAGWCGRLDLAHKLAAQYTGAAILPAQAA